MSDFRWSFSQWETYNACPAKWNYKSVLKLPSLPPGPAAARGLKMHDTVEKYIVQHHGEEGLHPDIKPKYIPIFNTFRDHPNGERHVEFKFGLTESWTLAGGMRSERTWVAMVLDAVRVGGPWVGEDKDPNAPIICHIGEWKSGKPKDTHGDQRKLYALGALVKWPWVDEVHATTYYLEDTGPPQRLVVRPSAADKLKDLWKGRVDMMQADRFLAPKPGMQCNWCDYAKKRGGPCAFGA